MQYDLVKTAFQGSQTVLTAVGDNKQRIMGWAMALEDAFALFEKDFGAERIRLKSNYRSSNQLVDIQHNLAVAIDSDCVKAESKISLALDGAACEIWEFSNEKQEALYLAQYISDQIQSTGITPRDCVVLVKQKAASYEDSLKSEFTSKGLKIRDESEIQNLLAEYLTYVIITFLRFGSREAAGVYWSDCCSILKELRGFEDFDIEAGRIIQEELSQFHSSLYVEIQSITISNEISMLPERVKGLLLRILAFVDMGFLLRIKPEYKQEDKITEIIDSISNLVTNYLLQSRGETQVIDWGLALDSFEGRDSIPLMTIHKSKGLEYHSVIFVGLEDSSWWSFKKDRKAGRSAFFVAFSRAKRQVIFTYCKSRANKKNSVTTQAEVQEK